MIRTMKTKRTVQLDQIKREPVRKHRKNCATLLACQKYPLAARVH